MYLCMYRKQISKQSELKKEIIVGNLKKVFDMVTIYTNVAVQCPRPCVSSVHDLLGIHTDRDQHKGCYGTRNKMARTSFR